MDSVGKHANHCSHMLAIIMVSQVKCNSQKMCDSTLQIIEVIISMCKCTVTVRYCVTGNLRKFQAIKCCLSQNIEKQLSVTCNAWIVFPPCCPAQHSGCWPCQVAFQRVQFAFMLHLRHPPRLTQTHLDPRWQHRTTSDASAFQMECWM